MKRSRILSIVIALTDVTYGLLAWWGKGQSSVRFSPLSQLIFIIISVLIALALIWCTDNVVTLSGSSQINPWFFNSWYFLNPKILKLIGWIMLLIWIPCGIWFGQSAMFKANL